VTPYLIVQGAARAIDFYKKAFGAEELFRMDGPGGSVMHAEVKIGNSPVMLADEFPDMGYVGPQALKGTPVSLMVYVENVDKVYERAIAAGAKVKRPIKDEFWGDRLGTVEDPFGHLWSLATHKEDVAPDEMQRRMEEQMKKRGGS
jgi:PhnB protein